MPTDNIVNERADKNGNTAIDWILDRLVGPNNLKLIDTGRAGTITDVQCPDPIITLLSNVISP